MTRSTAPEQAERQQRPLANCAMRWRISNHEAAFIFRDAAQARLLKDEAGRMERGITAIKKHAL